MDNLNSLFDSFWMAGFECSDQLNVHGERVDLLKETRHLDRLAEDYKNLDKFAIRTVREGIQWSKVEKAPYQYQWKDVIKVMKAANESGLQVIWDLCHFGFPQDLTPLHPKFTPRFRSLCEAFTRLHQEICPNRSLLVVPINEVSFMSWLGGDAAGTTPYCTGHGWEVKYHLMKAFIEGVKAIRMLEPSTKIILSEPLIRISTEIEDPDHEEEVRAISDNQFQVADMLCGKICPELGGKPDYLDVIGFNYYFPNQWNHELKKCLDWKNSESEKNYIPLYRLLIEAYERYRKPFIISETSNMNGDRPSWFEMISSNIKKLRSLHYPLLGVCIYPILDRPDWDELGFWHHSGLWDNLAPQGGSERVLYEPYARVILQEIRKESPSTKHRDVYRRLDR